MASPFPANREPHCQPVWRLAATTLARDLCRAIRCECGEATSGIPYPRARAALPPYPRLAVAYALSRCTEAELFDEFPFATLRFGLLLVVRDEGLLSAMRRLFFRRRDVRRGGAEIGQHRR